MCRSDCVASTKNEFRTKAAPSLQFRNIHSLNPLAGPLGLAEKREARFDARVIQEAAHRQATVKFSPPVPLDERGDNFLQRNAVQRIAGMGYGR